MPSFALYRARAWLSMHTRSRGRSQPVIARVFITLLVLFAVVFAVFSIALYRVQPVIIALSKAEAREHVILAMNEAIQSEITSGNLLYNEFVTLEKDNSGAVTALVTDMVKINVLQSRISSLVATNIVNMLSKKMSIPLGDALGGIFFTWEGPGIPVRMESVTNVTTQFVNEFDSAGINQTQHKIYLTVTADIDIAYPGGQTSAIVTTTVPIAETIIVGSVPNIYATPQS